MMFLLAYAQFFEALNEKKKKENKAKVRAVISSSKEKQVVPHLSVKELA